MAVNHKSVNTISKLLEAGFTTEKDILSMTLDEILSLPGIRLADVKCINELQKSIKENKIITFLCSNNNESDAKSD